MSQAKKRVPAVEGWFSMDEKEPHLLGNRCARNRQEVLQSRHEPIGGRVAEPSGLVECRSQAEW